MWPFGSNEGRNELPKIYEVALLRPYPVTQPNQEAQTMIVPAGESIALYLTAEPPQLSNSEEEAANSW
jgi:hypothetical protein